MDNPKSVNGTLILVLGILGLVLCPIFGLISWSMGTTALRTLDEGKSNNGAERSMASAGRICGIVSSVLWLIFLVVKFLAMQHG